MYLLLSHQNLAGVFLLLSGGGVLQMSPFSTISVLSNAKGAASVPIPYYISMVHSVIRKPFTNKFLTKQEGPSISCDANILVVFFSYKL